MRVENLTTLIYITRGTDCLFIRKTRKGDMNLDKYLGIGGHFESDESPEECVLRELYEEAQIKSDVLEKFSYRGFITFISSETDEMLRTCSRLVVMRDRKVVGELSGGDLTQNKIMSTIAGDK